jgi:potassium transporter
MFVAQEQVNLATVKAERQSPHPERQPKSCSPRSGTPRRLSLNEGRLPVPTDRMTSQGTSVVIRLRLRTDTKILRTLRPRHHKIMSESEAAVGPRDSASIAHARPLGPRWPVATIGALGVVFGEIGTSPIYTIQTIFNPEDPHPVAASSESVYGLLSLVFGQ